MHTALLLNSERSPSILDLKVALLTYDHVKLVDPADRDLFASSAFPFAMGMPPIMSLPTPNPTRELGKEVGYDDLFGMLIDSASPAIAQGSVSVVQTYHPPANSLIIGKVDTGDFPLDVRTLLWLFRAVASDQEFLAAAVEHDRWLFEDPERVWQIAKPRGTADGGINNSQPLPDLSIPLANESIREPLSNIARARIGHTLKIVGYCVTQGLVPHGLGSHHDRILRLILRNGARLVDQISEVDPYWNYRNRVLKLVHEEYLNMDRLNQMSVADVLALRTAAWGRQSEAREALFEAAGRLAREHIDESDFDKGAARSIRDYRQRAAEVEDERASLEFRISCEVGKAILGGTGATAAGALTALGTGVGVAGALVGIAYFALQKYQDLKPVSDHLKAAEKEFSGDLRFSIHNFYDRLR